MRITILAVPKSLCRLNPTIADSTMKPGAAGSIGVAVLARSTRTIVPDLAKYCPGDRFYMDCSPKADFMKYDEKTGKASIVAPKLDKDIGIQCTVTKKALNGDSEKKSFKITILGMPKSLCMINDQAIP